MAGDSCKADKYKDILSRRRMAKGGRVDVEIGPVEVESAEAAAPDEEARKRAEWLARVEAEDKPVESAVPPWEYAQMAAGAPALAKLGVAAAKAGSKAFTATPVGQAIRAFNAPDEMGALFRQIADTGMEPFSKRYVGKEGTEGFNALARQVEAVPFKERASRALEAFRRKGIKTDDLPWNQPGPFKPSAAPASEYVVETASPSAGLTDTANGALPHKLAELLQSKVSPAQVQANGRIHFKDVADWQRLSDTARTEGETTVGKVLGDTSHDVGAFHKAASDLRGAQAVERAQARQATGAPALVSKGEVTSAPGEAAYKGKTPQQRNDATKELLRQYFEIKGEKLNAGGTVKRRAKLAPPMEEKVLIDSAIAAGMTPDEAMPLDAERLRRHAPLKGVDTLTGEIGEVSATPEFFKSLADKVGIQYLSFGGTAKSPDELARDEFEDSGLGIPSGHPAMLGHATGADAPHKIVGVNTAPVQITEQIPHAELTAPPTDARPAAVTQSVPQHAEPAPKRNTLEDIEADRQAALEDARAGWGTTIGRALSNAALSFAGRPNIDFAAGDRARRNEINAEAKLRRDNYVHTPGEELARNTAMADSPLSGTFQKLVDGAVGQEGFAKDLPASAAKDVLGLINQVRQGQLSVDQMKLRLEEMRRKEGHDARMESIASRNADANMLRATKAGTKQEQDIIGKYRAEDAGKNSPGYAQAQKDIGYLNKLDELLSKNGGDISTQDLPVVAGELGRLATGGEGNQHMQQALSAETAEGRLNNVLRYFTGKAGSAGYKDIVNNEIKPYIAGIRKVVERQLRQHHVDKLKKWESSLPPEFVAAERTRLGEEFPESQVERRSRSVPAEHDVSDLGAVYR